MPNHVHMVIHVGRPDWSSYKPQDSSTPLSRILENLKWYTALKCNAALRRNGQFWQYESYDHVIRKADELERTIWYVLNNPVKAGFVQSWEQWPWSYAKLGLL
jgi:REP element-mobilizing transposase RayT